MRTLIKAVFIGFLAFNASAHANAHVEIVNSFPEQYANVNPIPTQLWIEFSGNLQTLEGEAVNSIEVIDSTGIAVNYQDPVISGGRITTKISGQSAPGVFTVIYRVVGDDGHVIEGEYTFNASPDYAEVQTPTPINTTEQSSSTSASGILIGVIVLLLCAGLFMRVKNRSK
jgi:methionine-rich copper-binding protein CopC